MFSLLWKFCPMSALLVWLLKKYFFSTNSHYFKVLKEIHSFQAWLWMDLVPICPVYNSGHLANNILGTQQWIFWLSWNFCTVLNPFQLDSSDYLYSLELILKVALCQKLLTGGLKKVTIYFPIFYLVKSSENILFFYLHFTWLQGVPHLHENH